jgi:hypothetical protein
MVAAVLVVGGVAFAAGMLLMADLDRRASRGPASAARRRTSRDGGGAGDDGAPGVVGPDDRARLALADLDLDAMDMAAAAAMVGGGGR